MSRTLDLKHYALWRECIRRQVDSGLTIAQFCAREGLSVAAFHSWKRRLRCPASAGNGETPRPSYRILGRSFFDAKVPQELHPG
jgi:hypothetical protein